jgi:hypothetical protein
VAAPSRDRAGGEAGGAGIGGQGEDQVAVLEDERRRLLDDPEELAIRRRILADRFGR